MLKLKLITLTNGGYCHYTLNAIESIKRCGLYEKCDIVVYCADEAARSLMSCHGYNVKTPSILFKNLDKLTKYKQKGWPELMILKLTAIRDELLETRSPLLWFDGDVVFLREDACEKLLSLAGPDDELVAQRDGDPCINRICAGFMYCKPTQNIIDLMNPSKIKLTPNWDDQSYINQHLHELKYQILDHLQFPNGWSFIEQHINVWEHRPYIAHYNWCIGTEKEQHMLANNHWYTSYDTAIVNKYGIMDRCDVKPERYQHDTKKLDVATYNNIQPNNYVYVISSVLDQWVSEVLPTITCNFFLVTGDAVVGPSEALCRDQFQLLVGNQYLIHWYASNYDLPEPHTKITAIPLGIDYHALRKDKLSPYQQETTLFQVRASGHNILDRLDKSFSFFHFQLFKRHDYDRYRAIKQLNTLSGVNDFLSHRTERVETWKKMVDYQFIVSPHGNGLDCHRTYEAIALGCIPIVKSSPLDVLYKGLPVLILNDWSELTRETLDNYIRHGVLPDGTVPDKIKLSYWNDAIFGNSGSSM